MDLHTPADVNAKMVEIRGKAWRIMEALEPLCERAAELENKTDLAHVATFLACEGAMDLRKITAREAEYDVGREELIILQAKIKMLQRKLDQLDRDLDTVRSIGASIRRELDVLSDGRP
jgi:hypothetical protein